MDPPIARPTAEIPHPGGKRRVPRWLVRALVIALLAAAAFEALWSAGALVSAEALVTDLWWAARAPIPAAESPVTLITVDDETLARHPEPLALWGPHFGRAIAALRDGGATAVGLDFQFAMGADEWLREFLPADDPRTRAWDGPLLAQLVQGDVVLAMSLRTTEGQGPGWAYDPPPPMFQAVLADKRAQLGITTLHLDSDGVVRRTVPVFLPEADQPSLTFALALALAHTGQGADQAAWELGGRAVGRAPEELEIAWSGPPDTRLEVPLYRLLEPELLTAEDREAIAGRIAILGIDYAQSGDRWFTPYWRTHRDQASRSSMTGHEVHANIAAQLLDGRRIWRPGRGGRLALFLLAGLAVSAVAMRAPTRAGVGTLLVALVSWPLAGGLLFAAADAAVPAASIDLLLVGVYAVSYTVRFDRAARRGRFLRQVFSRYVSDAVVEQILSSPEGLNLGGVRRDVTVLFMDIRDFTSISERLTPEEVVELLNAYFDRVCRPVLEHGGSVDKFIGDSVMAVFGTPIPSRNHARRAILAAMGMRREVQAFTAWVEARFGDRGLPPFQTGIGVHTGPAVAGNVGFERRTEYTVIGDTVNTASRIEGLTKHTGWPTLISIETYQAAGPGVQVGRSTVLEVKGRQQPVKVLELLGLSGPEDSLVHVEDP